MEIIRLDTEMGVEILVTRAMTWVKILCIGLGVYEFYGLKK